MEEEELKEGANTAENKETQDTKEAPQISNEEMAKFINSWFLNIRNVIRVVKEKDANLYKMNNELQSYRNDFSRQLFKSMSQYVINFREDCAKSLRDAQAYELKKEDIVKYIGYVSQDFETFLENLGIEIAEDKITMNGTDISSAPAEIKPFELPQTEETASAVDEGAEELAAEAAACVTQQQVVELLDKRTEEIKAILKDNAKLDAVILEYIKQSQLIERNEKQIVLYPVVREFVNYHASLKAQTSEAIADPEKEAGALLEDYKTILTQVIDKMEDVLDYCDVKIDKLTDAGDVYDPKKHRIMKFVPVTAEEADKNGKIVKVYTDCYVMGDKVTYPAKVDVYKVK